MQLGATSMTQPPVRVLAIDDDPGDLELIRRYLDEMEGREVLLSVENSLDDAILALTGNTVDIILLDYRLGPDDGVDALEPLREVSGGCPIVILTGYGEANIAVKALKSGAADYLSKNDLSPIALERTILQALQSSTLERNRSNHRLIIARANEELRQRCDSAEERNRTLTVAIADHLQRVRSLLQQTAALENSEVQDSVEHALASCLELAELVASPQPQS